MKRGNLIMNSKNTVYFRCFYGYGISGMAVLAIGAILPSLIREAGISYVVAGGLLSAMAIGNLLASLIFPAFTAWVGTRWTITAITGLVPVSYLLLTFLPPLSIMYLLMLLAGICRGSVTILNNQIVNDVSNHSPRILNLLHCSFAVGAFLSPFLTALMLAVGLGWRSILYLLVFLCSTSTLLYATLPYKTLPVPKKSDGMSILPEKSNRRFLRSFDFYCTALILFFYLGTENCVNGWFVTYLQNTGVMSETYATSLVSFTWLVIMLGRLACAVLAKRVLKSTMILAAAVGSGLCFFILISSTNLTVITIALLCFGFFLSGIYPSCIANAGPLVQGSSLGMSVLAAISAMGGILFPQLVGIAADKVGIVAAVSILVFNVILVILFSFVNFRRMHPRSE